VKTIPAGLAAHLQGKLTSVALCWRITRTDNTVIRGTESDATIRITAGAHAGEYPARAGITGSVVKSTHDMSVDNVDVQGALDDALSIIDLNAADLEAGLFDQAEVVLFLCDATTPDDGQVIIRKGSIGNASWTSEGQYRAELRGMFQYYSQIPIRTYGQACDAELGDARCGVDLSSFEVGGTVTAIANRRRFDSILAASPAVTNGDYLGGLLTFTTGNNAGFSREIKQDAVGNVTGAIEVVEAFPVEVVPGDLFTMRPGCDKALTTCRDRFNNILNFRGHGVYVPGQNEVLKVGGQ